MEQFDRPHFRNTSTGSSTTTSTSSELFICFTSRLSSSSSSMKLTKSIFSPGRAARDGGPVSLSSSLSRRLRTNGSLKAGGGGQASPFFTTGKKRGCGFENPEPTSPKVTCIGQVRVKTKKRVKKSRSLSTRRNNGEVSFRKNEEKGNCNHQQQECLPHRNQRWVHLPISICEALRAFGAEFNCLFPCKSSCFSNSESEKVDKGNENGCGAVFTRWFVSVNDGESGKRREIELVVGGGDEEEEERRFSMRSSRRHVFEDIEVKGDIIEVKGHSGNGNTHVDEEIEEEEARVSICVPPKNALLLMRCRSDPMKMASLAHRFSWDAHATSNEHNVNPEEEKEESNGDDENEGKDEIFIVKETEALGEVLEENVVSAEPNEERGILILAEKTEDSNLEMEIQEHELAICNEEMVENKEIEVNDEASVVEEEVESNMSSFEALLDQENPDQHYEDCPIQGEEEEENSPICHLSTSTTSSQSSEDSESEEDVTGSSTEAPPPPLENELEENNPKPDPEKTHQELPKPTPENLELMNPPIIQEEPKKKERPVLPECLLLMMCEPKLSMEVSKETWVCSTDFIRWLPQRPPKQPPPLPKSATKSGEPVRRRLSTDTKPKQIDNIINDQNQLPPRSSCSLPMPAAAMIEQKLMNAVGYEPFALTRCKSEPMRTAAAKLMPESCLWKNAIRKLDPHRRATIGVGAAGVGC
ncbi:hypothetical protein ACJIZ3_007129 [Penstemon smallii]|uniref:Uncharacterized protein n=1 Tax=Penstemon smallii TaxID=265156 RepID=A0ABD3S9N3_9LAMI